MEPCAIVCRVSPSFLRFGSFETCLGINNLRRNPGPNH